MWSHLELPSKRPLTSEVVAQDESARAGTVCARCLKGQGADRAKLSKRCRTEDRVASLLGHLGDLIVRIALASLAWNAALSDHEPRLGAFQLDLVRVAGSIYARYPGGS